MPGARPIPVFYSLRASLICLLLAVALLSPLIGCTNHSDRIVVGSKNFTEQLILGELFAQVIEARTHLPGRAPFYLAGTFICQQAILAGRIDIYPDTLHSADRSAGTAAARR